MKRVCLDQCSVGRSWTFHTKLQMRCLLITVWDLYHRMWSDNRAEVPAAEGQRFLLFAYNACFACSGPWNTHGNFDSKKAWFIAWLSSSCASSKWFLENLQELAHDRGVPVAVGEASVKVFFESLKECTSLSAIEAQPRMMSLFSLYSSIMFFFCQDSLSTSKASCPTSGGIAKRMRAHGKSQLQRSTEPLLRRRTRRSCGV